jgi:hypothetical protein
VYANAQTVEGFLCIIAAEIQRTQFSLLHRPYRCAVAVTSRHQLQSKGFSMKNARHMMLAATLLVFANVALAQSTSSAAAAKADPNAPYSADPLVQKRQADKVATDEYKARKKAAKKKMKEEKAAAKAEMKAEKKEATQTRKDAMATPAK